MVIVMVRWNREEIDILVKNFGIRPIREWINLLPGRTWDAIQGKATRMGLVSDLRGPIPRYDQGSEISGETLEEIWEAAYAFQKAAKRLSTRKDDLDVYLDVDYPIALVFIADLHIGAVTVPLDRVRERFQRMAEFEHLYAISVGDTVDNYLPQRHPQGMFSTLFPPELQKELVTSLYRMLYGRWIGLVQGCHAEMERVLR